ARAVRAEGRRDLPYAAASSSFAAAPRGRKRVSGDRAYAARRRERRLRVVLPEVPPPPPPRGSAAEEHRARPPAALRAVSFEQGAAHLRKVRRRPSGHGLTGDLAARRRASRGGPARRAQ